MKVSLENKMLNSYIHEHSLKIETNEHKFLNKMFNERTKEKVTNNKERMFHDIEN